MQAGVSGQAALAWKLTGGQASSLSWPADFQPVVVQTARQDAPSSLTGIKLALCAGVALLFSLTSQAADPGAKDLDAAITSGDFAAYAANLTTWIGRKVPVDPGG